MRGGETQGNMSGILSTGYGAQALVWGSADWRLLPWMIHFPQRERNVSSLISSWLITDRHQGLFFYFCIMQYKKLWNIQITEILICTYSNCVVKGKYRLMLSEISYKEGWLCQTVNSIIGANLHNDSRWPEPTHVLRLREPAVRLSSTPLTQASYSMRDKKLKTVNSYALALQQHPFSCCSSHELCYRQGKRRGWKRRKKKVERFIPFVFSLCVALPHSLVPPLLNLTIKQHCKNRMFLAEAQQWQSREGEGPYVRQKKKSLFPVCFALKMYE